MNLSGSVKINKCGMLILTIGVILLFYYLLFSSSGMSRHQRHYAFMLRNPNDISLRKLLIGSIQASQMGGAEVETASFDIHAKSKGQTKEGVNDPVTNADLRSHCVMEHGLKRLFPKIKIISEEATSKCDDVNHFELDPTVIDEDVLLPDDYVVNADDVTVWIDPLDATKEFTGKICRMNPTYLKLIITPFLLAEKLFEYVTTMVCVAVKGEPIIGIIHNPFTHQTVWAWKDVAVSESIRKIYEGPVSRMEAVKNPKIIVSRSHSGDVKELVKKVFGENTPIIIGAGAGYKVLQVVYGNATNYMHLTNIKKWDICAGHAILNTLGGKMTTLKNQAITYDSRDPFVNEEGVLATLRNHEYYASKIVDYYQQLHFFKDKAHS